MIRFFRTWARHTIQAHRNGQTLPAWWEIRDYLRLTEHPTEETKHHG